jgi:hypothetical protein
LFEITTTATGKVKVDIGKAFAGAIGMVATFPMSRDGPQLTGFEAVLTSHGWLI